MDELSVKYEGNIGRCLICNEPVRSSLVEKTAILLIACPRCGEYKITTQAIMSINSMQWTPKQRTHISSWLYEYQIYEISTKNLDALSNVKAPSFHDRADRFLLNLEKQTDLIGQRIQQTPSWLSAAWCYNDAELDEIKNYLGIEGRVNCDGAGCKILPNGWARLEEIKKINAESQQCFVAMWFVENMNKIYDEIIAKAILDAGYRPHRVDKREHVEQIDDEIIAQIKRSRFIVADFTGHRGGVYYEAGFAKGLGLDVIWTCCKADMDYLHFDIRQYNCIDWEEDKLDEFAKRLTNRIEAVLGRGAHVF